MPVSRRVVLGALASLALAATYGVATGLTDDAIPDTGERMIITLEDGEVVIALRPDVAPLHVAQVKAIANFGDYDNVAFHRVIDGFMAQTGDIEFGDMEDNYDPQRVGTGGSSLGNIKAEFSDIPFERGVVGMARSQHPDSASSQFFIMFSRAPHLNGQYTVIGHVISGMEHVDKLAKGDSRRNGAVENPDRMIKVTVRSAE
jgi:cyclophilin family peptidyl-prolyl cis-trans isomerase